MGREVRRVPSDWQHPKEYNPNRGSSEFKPLYERDWASAAAEWDCDRAKWEAGERPDYASDYARDYPFDQWEGRRPFSEDYMPNWPAEQRTHFMMYEDTTEGTPISPAFATPEELARWLVDNNASAFGGMTADYDHWLRVARGGWAPSMIITGGVVESGVQALSSPGTSAPNSAAKSDTHVGVDAIAERARS